MNYKIKGAPCVLADRSSYDLQSDDPTEPLLLPPPLSSAITNNCNTSTLIFTRRHKTAAALANDTTVLRLNRGAAG